MGLRPLGGGGGAAAAQTMWGAIKPTDTARSNVIAYADDPHLTLANVPAGTYALEGWLHYDATTTGDIRLSWTLPTGGTMFYGTQALLANATSVSTANTKERFTEASTPVIGGIGTGGFVEIRPLGGVILTTAGTFALRWAQGTAEATATTVYAGSWIRLSKLA